MKLQSFGKNNVAIVFGSSGGIGAACKRELINSNSFSSVIAFSRDENGFDIKSESSIKDSINQINSKEKIRLAIDATGFLQDNHQKPEKTFKHFEKNLALHCFHINAIGPLLLMKNLFPHLPRKGKTVFATLSARVGSIGDNRSGGWYSYRASKAALNQFVRTAALELSRTHPEAICVALHPGTVKTDLSKPFLKENNTAFAPDESAKQLLTVIDNLRNNATGGFFDWLGNNIPW